MLSLAKFIKKELQLRENLVGLGFQPVPDLTNPTENVKRAANDRMQQLEQEKEEYPFRVTVTGEIVSAQGFQAQQTYIMYQVFLPEQDKGWSFEDVNDYEQLKWDKYAEFNKRKSVTHISQGRVEYTDDVEDEDPTKYVSHFCFPFEYQFIARHNSAKRSRPYLLLQVNSTDSWNRHRVEGYSFVQLPFQNGYHQLEVETWRPRASLDTEIHSFFLGGSVRISKLEELVRTSYIDQDNFYEVVNRFGLETEDAGSIKVNINICTQDKSTQFQRRDLRRQLKQNEKLQSRKLVMDFVKQDNKRKQQDQNQKILGEYKKGKDSDSDFGDDAKLSDDDGIHANPIGVGGQTGFMAN